MYSIVVEVQSRKIKPSERLTLNMRPLITQLVMVDVQEPPGRYLSHPENKEKMFMFTKNFDYDRRMDITFYESIYRE